MITTFYVERQGRELFTTMGARGLEGIVAKRKESRYRIGIRSEEW